MRKYTPPSEALVGNPSFLATMNFVESALYPVADPSVARPVGTVSDVNYRTVYETVFFGNQRIPGLFSQVVAPAKAPEIQPPPTDQIVETIKNALEDFSLTDAAKSTAQVLLRSAQIKGQDALSKVGSATELSAGVIADIGIKILEPLGWAPYKRSAFKRIVGQTWDRITKESLQPGPARTTPSDTTIAPSSPAGSPATQVQPQTKIYAQSPSQNRVTNLANALVPVIRYQDFKNIPYGRDDSEFIRVPSPKLEKAKTDRDSMKTQYDAMVGDTPEKFDLGEKLGKLDAEILTMENNESDLLYRPIPGRGPLVPLPAPSPLVVDYSRRRNVDPQRFTPELQRIFAANDALMQEPAPFGSGSGPLGQINETMLTEEQIASEMRELRRQNKLSDAYQRIASVRPRMNVDKISDINGIDDYGYQEFSAFVFDAQRMGLTYEQYLAQLENDPEQLSRAARTGGGGGGGVTIRLPSDDDLTSVFKYVSQATIGRTLPKEVYQSMIDAYKPQLVRFQQQAAGGGTVTEPPQAETFAETQIEQQFGQEAFTYKMGGFLDRLSQIGGGQ
jgi:hypothetical protein